MPNSLCRLNAATESSAKSVHGGFSRALLALGEFKFCGCAVSGDI